MSRKGFLSTLSLASISALAWGVRALRAREREGSVLVVGAGMAGIGAARELKSEGFDVIVLEARDRLGGRIWTDDSLGLPMDMGAGWIHESRGNPIAALASKLGIKTAPSDYDSVHLYDAAGRHLNEEAMERLSTKVEAILAEAQRLGEESDRDIPVRKAVELALERRKFSPSDRAALEWGISTMEIAAAADFSELSLHADEDEGFGGEDLIFPGGYDQVVRGVAKGLDIRLKHRVQVIHHSAKGVRIETDRGDFEADGAVVTLPLGVLKSGAVKFSPALPGSKEKAIRGLGMGLLDKVALRFEERFWPETRDFLGYMSARPGEFPVFINWAHYTGKPCLLATIGARFAREMEKGSEAETVEAAVGVLRKMFGGKVSALKSSRASRWAADPFAGGSYSFIPVGGSPKSFDALAEPVGRLFFAGEATSRAYAATVHGAWLSGIREAERIAAI